MPTLAPDMSLGGRLDGVLRLKSSFRDRHEHRAYVRAFLLAKQLLERPELVAQGRRYLERFVKDDPRQRRIYDLWTQTLEHPVEEIVVQLLSDNARGASLRETAPMFVVIPPEEVQALERLPRNLTHSPLSPAKAGAQAFSEAPVRLSGRFSDHEPHEPHEHR